MPRSRAPVWSPLPGHRLLKGRAGHTATLVGKKLLVLGGRNGNEFFNDLWEFDLEVNKWRLLQKHSPLKPRAYHTATLIQDNQLWVIGGSDSATMYGDVHSLNTDTLEWTSPVPTEGELAGKLRGTHAAVQHPLKPKGILIFGGYGGLGTQWLNDLAILHTDTLKWEELQPQGVLPSARGYHSFTVFGLHVLLFGGKRDTGIVSSDSMSVYDALLNRWIAPTLKGMSPRSRSNHAAILVNEDLILIHGGRFGSERLNDFCLLQIHSPPVAGCVDSLVWHVIEEEKTKAQKKGTLAKSRGPGGRSAHTLVVEDSSLYLFGGYGGSGSPVHGSCGISWLQRTGLTFDDMFVIHNFHEVAAVKTRLTGAAPQNGDKTSAVRRRSQFDFVDTDGWRSTKQPRGLTHLSVKSVPNPEFHILDSDDDVSAGGPANVEPGRAHVTRMDALFNTSTMPSVRRTSEKDRQEQDKATLQQVVDTLKVEVTGLKAEVNGKNLLESELRASKAALQQNIQLLQKQVEDGSQKKLLFKSEIEKLKVEARDLSVQVDNKEQERYETQQKLKSAEQKSEKLCESVEQTKTAFSKATQELDICRLRAQNLQGDVEKQMHEIQQLHQNYEYERKTAQESREKMSCLSNELESSKDSARAMQETLERLSKHVERANATINALEDEKEKLSFSNSMLSAEQVHLVEAKERAESMVERVKGEVRVARSVIERNAVESAQMKESSDQAKEHITSLHATLVKNEEEKKSMLNDNSMLRLLVKGIEDFENAQVRNIQNHVEKLRCAREFGPRP